MKTKNKVLIIGIIIAIIVLAVAVVFIVKEMNSNTIIKQTEEKLKSINSKELEEKLIQKLDKTEIHLTDNIDGLLVMTSIAKGIKIADFITVQISCWDEKLNLIGFVEIPCFKIKSDSNGKFRNIEYTIGLTSLHETIANTVEEVLEKEYGIKRYVSGNAKYNDKFDYMKYNNEDVYFTNDRFLMYVATKFSSDNNINDTYVFMTKYSTRVFGIDPDKT